MTNIFFLCPLPVLRSFSGVGRPQGEAEGLYKKFISVAVILNLYLKTVSISVNQCLKKFSVNLCLKSILLIQLSCPKKLSCQRNLRNQRLKNSVNL